MHHDAGNFTPDDDFEKTPVVTIGSGDLPDIDDVEEVLSIGWVNIEHFASLLCSFEKEGWFVVFTSWEPDLIAIAVRVMGSRLGFAGVGITGPYKIHWTA